MLPGLLDAHFTDNIPSGSILQLAAASRSFGLPEYNPVEERLPNTLSLRESVVVVEWVVNAGIESGDGCFRRGRSEGAERARGLRRDQAMIGEQGVSKRHHTEHVREDRRGCA